MPNRVKNMLGGGPKALVALGGNISGAGGSPAETLRAAMAALEDSALTVEAASRLYSTPCYPAGAGPDYVNSAAVLSGARSAEDLLSFLHAIETRFGRERRQRWEPRTLDIDLIAFGNAVLPDLATFLRWRDMPEDEQLRRTPEELVLPHPRLQDRAFVLVPLAEAAPDWRHPASGLTVREMKEALPAALISAVRALGCGN